MLEGRAGTPPAFCLPPGAPYLRCQPGGRGQVGLHRVRRLWELGRLGQPELGPSMSANPWLVSVCCPAPTGPRKLRDCSSASPQPLTPTVCYVWTAALFQAAHTTPPTPPGRVPDPWIPKPASWIKGSGCRGAIMRSLEPQKSKGLHVRRTVGPAPEGWALSSGLTLSRLRKHGFWEVSAAVVRISEDCGAF